MRLEHRRVAVTHVRHDPDRLTELLFSLGAEVISAPTHELMPPEDGRPLHAAIEQLASYDAVVFTSAAGVRWFLERLHAQRGDHRALEGRRIAAVGTGTAQALEERGLRVEVVPAEHRGEALAEALKLALAPDARVLLARAQEGREVLPEELRRAGMQVEVVPVYRSVPVPAEELRPLAARLEAGEVDAITFASGSAARALVSAFGGAVAFEKTVVACLGPVTAEGCAEMGLQVAVQAPTATYEALTEALVQHFAREQ